MSDIDDFNNDNEKCCKFDQISSEAFEGLSYIKTSFFLTEIYLDQCLVHHQPRIHLCYPACSLALEVIQLTAAKKLLFSLLSFAHLHICTFDDSPCNVFVFVI